jgi:hypothetical protein
MVMAQRFEGTALISTVVMRRADDSLPTSVRSQARASFANTRVSSNKPDRTPVKPETLKRLKALGALRYGARRGLRIRGDER